MSAIPLRRRFERYAIAHASGYLLALAWAVASIPLVIHRNIRDIERLGSERAVGDFVVHKLAWPAAVAFAAPHIAALPWAFGRDPARWARTTWIAIGSIAGVAVLVGGSSWAWLLLR